ncbi:2-hydroxyacid dehydrogenase [Pedobacter psychroterrae]|uniref:Hydroxyacid dehydrogenase n=1 Tax=Pedobacter psychroterrae TaxID=2530453 RepID=A0A4R0N9F6_9SPHI|nr:hydroxyacid dehydrogenase [Pedobacter psychroterrae]TCC96828.1 hydroxyacid dehydrogenase [Pedobacter psychroterrae]
MKKNVLLLETIADEALGYLSKHVNVFTAYDEASLKTAVDTQEIHAIITRGKGQIDKALLEAFPAVKVVARCGVGLDNVAVNEATSRNVMVINAPGSNAATIAEHTFSLMLMLMRNMYESARQVKQGNWNWRNQYSGDELNGKTLGIIGMGNIGQRVAKLGEAFGMHVIYWSRSAKDSTASLLTMDEVLRQSDVISLHLPLTSETDKLIGADQIELMKPGSLLINTARAALIDHQVLLEALDNAKIAGFAADVLPEEPPLKDEPIINHPKTIITPHSGSLTAATYQKMCYLTVQNVVAVLTGNEPDQNSIFNRSDLQKNK